METRQILHLCPIQKHKIKISDDKKIISSLNLLEYEDLESILILYGFFFLQKLQ